MIAQNARIMRAAMDDARQASRDALFPPVVMPVDVTDEAAFPNIAEACRHLASLSPERRAELDREWL